MLNFGSLAYGYGYATRDTSTQYPYFLQPFDESFYTPPYTVPFDPFTGYPLPLSLTEVKTYLKIDPDITADDDLITSLMAAATSAGEKYTKRDFIIKKYLTYRDCFGNVIFTLRKSPYYDLISFEYLVDDVFVAVDPTTYYTTNQQNYSSIVLGTNKSWPNNIDERLQAIKIIFQAGYGFLASDVPMQLRLAIMQHVSQMYANRGDCSDGGGSEGGCGSAMPSQAKLLYDQFRIFDLYTNPYN